MKQKAFLNWSGGKDSAYCLYKVLQEKEYDISFLLTSINSNNNRISTHNLRTRLLEMQSDRLKIPLQKILLPEMPASDVYESTFRNILKPTFESGIRKSIYGDIFLEDLRRYREKQMSDVGMEAVFPLWKMDTKNLVEDFIAQGFKAIVICVNAQFLPPSFLGRIIDGAFLRDLPAGVDPCGENGEFHSFVFDGPIFSRPINFTKGAVTYKTFDAPTVSSSRNKNEKKYGFWYCDVM